jgi:hypothetical protein
VEQGTGRLCPRCGTPRVGNFRWCRSCQFDFDADRVARPTVASTPPAPSLEPAPRPEPAFALPIAEPTRSAPPAPLAPAPGPSAPAPVAAPVATPAPAFARPAAWSRVPPRIRLPLTVAGVVAVVLAIALLLIPSRSSSPAAIATPSASGAAATVAPTRAVVPTPFGPINLSGTRSQDVAFSIPDGSSALASILHDGQGAFSVWTVGADGTRNEQLVSVVGPFRGTRLFDQDRHSTAFSIESDGSWSIEVSPISTARTWDLSERLTGDGSDVVLVLPPISTDANVTVRYDGESNFVVSAYTSGGKVQLLNDIGPLEQPLVLPAGTSLLEIQADAAWSIAPP